MFKQFWVEFSIVLGLALVAFLGFQLPHWTIFSEELRSDAIPLGCVLFVNSYFAFILAFASFCTGAFLHYRLGYTALPHIVCALISIIVVACIASYASAVWQHRLQNAHTRLALLEQQSLQHQAGNRAVLYTPNMLLLAEPAPGEPALPILAAKLDNSVYAGGRLSLLDWRIEESVLLGTNLVKLPASVPANTNSDAAHPAGIPAGKSIEDLVPKTAPCFISPALDSVIARIIHWPIVDPRAEKETPLTEPASWLRGMAVSGFVPAEVLERDEQTTGLEGLLFLIGVSLLSAGAGLCMSKRGLSLIQALASVFVFLLLIVLPLALVHSYWLSADSELAEQSIPWIRAIITLALGLPCFLLGLRRRRRMETREER